MCFNGYDPELAALLAGEPPSDPGAVAAPDPGLAVLALSLILAVLGLMLLTG